MSEQAGQTWENIPAGETMWGAALWPILLHSVSSAPAAATLRKLNAHGWAEEYLPAGLCTRSARAGYERFSTDDADGYAPQQASVDSGEGTRRPSWRRLPSAFTARRN